MVQIKISQLLGKRRMTQKALAELTGIRPATISKMYYDEAQRVELDQLSRICQALDCSIAELLEYVPDSPGKK